MATVVLDAFSKAYPAITNRIRASVTLSNDTAIIASIIDTTAGHPSRIWHFPGLPRANYSFSLDEIDGGGTPINNLALFDVVPGTIDGLLTRADEQIQAGVTTGFTAGVNVAVFDGTAGKPNYIGWDIVPSELTGRGILVRGLDYSWDSVTGTMTLLQAGDIFTNNTYYNIHFNPIQQSAGNSVASVNDFQTRVVTTTQTLLTGDFGNQIVVEPSGVYIELTLPDITTVPQGRVLTLELSPVIGNSPLCVKVLPGGGNTINFLRGSIYMMSGESLQIYRLIRGDFSTEWRVRLPYGNFYNVGQEVSEDYIATGVVNKRLLDGSDGDKFQFARLYNEFILNLPSVQLVDYDSWSTGNNKYLFSRANSSNPSFANKFKFPDRRGLFERNNTSGKAGDFADESLKAHSHRVKIGGSNAHDPVVALTKSNLTDGYFQTDTTSQDFVEATGGTETAPKHYLKNKFVLV